MILIDTSVAIEFLRGKERAVSRLKSELAVNGTIALSSVSLFEMLAPMYHRKLVPQEHVVKSFVHQMKVLPVESAASEEAARIMGSLLRLGKAVNALDVLIAGTGAANGVERVLSVDKDFEKIAEVSELKVEIL